MIYTVWQLMLSTWDIKVNLPFPGPLSLSLQHLLSPTTSCSRPDRVDQRHPTGTDWADVKRNMGTSSTGTDWALRSRILSQYAGCWKTSIIVNRLFPRRTNTPPCLREFDFFESHNKGWCDFAAHRSSLNLEVKPFFSSLPAKTS